MVETFKNKELESSIFDLEVQDEWKELAESLGLKTQLAFVKNSKSPLPYPWINTSMNNIFSTLCPRTIEFTKYDKTPIPIDVLREASFCKHEKYFNKMEVWYNDNDPDPFLIGVLTMYKTYYKDAKGDTKSTDYEFLNEDEINSFVGSVGGVKDSIYSTDKKFLIARWGDEMRPMAELKKIAREKLKETLLTDWKVSISKLKAKIESAEEHIDKYLDGTMSMWDLERS